VAIFNPDIKVAEWETTQQELRAQLLKEVPWANPQLRDLSGPAGVRLDGYPLDFAIRGKDFKLVREFANQLAAKLIQTGKLIDVAYGPKTTPQSYMDIDRAKVEALGVRLSDLVEAVQVAAGSNVTDFGRSKLHVQLDKRDGNGIELIKKLQVRARSGKMVPLSTLVSFKEASGPSSVDRVDLRPAATISANPAAGVSLAEARWLCETLAEQVRKEMHLPAENELIWLQDVPAAKPMHDVLKAEPAPLPPEVTVASPVSREVTDFEDFTGALMQSRTSFYARA
jgi:multidrug efflux pump